MAEVCRNVDEEQICKSCSKCLGKGHLLPPQRRSVLVQVLLHGGADRRLCKSSINIFEVDGLVSRGKGLDGLHQILRKNG